jgi:putative ABC transport system permease protein
VSDQELDAELAEHVRRLTEANLARGLGADEARRAALLSFGNPDLVRETVRSRRSRLLEDLGRDLAHGLRTWRQSPALAALVVLTLGLGIGACVAIFSVVHAVLLRPPPFAEPQRLVVLREVPPGRGEELPVAPGKFLQWQREARSFHSLAAAAGTTYNATGDGAPALLYALRISANLLPTLGLHPLLGRNFTAADEVELDQENVAVLSHRLWQTRFGGRADILGRPLQLNGRRFTVVGVLPRNTPLPAHTDLFTPLGYSATNRANFSFPFLRVYARLAPHATLAEAQAEMTDLSARIGAAQPVARGWDVRVVPAVEALVGDVRPVLLALLGAVGFLLLIACANVANLLLARAGVRTREMAVRASLGATRGRLLRQLLVESLLLALLGAALGVALAQASLGLLARLPPDALPRASEVALDRWALAVALALAIGTGVGVGLLPARAATRPLTTRPRLRGALVIAEVALALVLLTGAGLLMRSFTRLIAVDPGFRPAGAAIGTIFLPRSLYPARPQHARFAQSLVDGLAALPGVTAAAVVTNLPFSGGVDPRTFTLTGSPATPAEQLPTAHHHRVSGGYFAALGIPLLRGRSFDDRDGADAPAVIVVNQALARAYFPDRDPVGQSLALTGDGPAEIVGVVGDVRAQRLEDAITFQIYRPFAQSPGRSFTYVVRTAGATTALPAAISRVVTALDPAQPTEGIRPLLELVGDSLARRRFALTLFGAFSLAALLLASLGIYGVMAYTVAQRTGEIGVRVALGARTATVVKLILLEGGRLVLAGLGLGVAGALLVTRTLQGLLFGVTPHDPATFAAIASLLTAVAAVACVLPALRAARVDPMVALRAE